MWGALSLAVVACIVGIILGAGYILGTLFIERRKKEGLSLSDINAELDIRKSIYAIIGGASIIFGAYISLNEIIFKEKVEDREILYGALAQLLESKGDRPDLSAAALLQFDRLAKSAPSERAPLVTILAGYLNERARWPVAAHEAASSVRPDIQVGADVLSRILAVDDKLGSTVVLNNVDMRRLNLRAPNFNYVKLIGVDLSLSQLEGANFRMANLTGVSFKDASIANVDFDGAIIDLAKFDNADVSGINFCSVKSRARVDLASVRKSEGAKCLTSSTP